MDGTRSIQPDSILNSYVAILGSETRFRAKIQYTLTCINNCLACSGPAYAANMTLLARSQDKLIEITKIYGDVDLLEPVGLIVERLAQGGVVGVALDYMRVIEGSSIEGELTDGFVKCLMGLLGALKHHYMKTKQICMKLLSRNLSSRQSQQVLATLSRCCLVTAEQCCTLSEQPHIAPLLVLELAWLSSLKSGSVSNSCVRIVQKYLNEFWFDEQLKYSCARLALCGGIRGFMQEWSRNNYKGLYLFYKKQKHGQIGKKSNFKIILQFLHRELPFWATQQAKETLELLQRNISTKQQQQIITCLLQLKTIPEALQQAFNTEIPIGFVTAGESVLMRLRAIPTPENAFRVLENFDKIVYSPKDDCSLQIYIQIVKIYLSNKQVGYLKTIDELLGPLMSNKFKTYPDLAAKNIEALLLIGFVFPKPGAWEQLPSAHQQKLTNSIEKFMNSETTTLQYKFYVARWLLLTHNQKAFGKFVNFLIRALGKEQLPYVELAHYLRNCSWPEETVLWLGNHFEEELERILQKVFARLADPGFRAPKLIIFALQKHQVFQEWEPIYRWALNPLDEPSPEDPEGLIDNLEVFESVIQNCRRVPIEIIKRFFRIVVRHWQSYNHHHLFTIERISRTLFSEQELAQQELQDLSSFLNSLISQFESNPEPNIFKISLSLLLQNTLLQQAEDITLDLTKQIFREISSIGAESVCSPDALRVKLYAQELLMWLFQYEDDNIHQKVGDALIKLLNNQHIYQISNEADRTRLVENSLEIVSTVSHECNLLELALGKILTSHIKNKAMISFATQVVASVKEANIKAVSKLGLEGAIPQILVTLAIEKDTQLIQNYVAFLEQLCLAQNSPCRQTILANKVLVSDILRSEALMVVQSHRPEVAAFALNIFSQLSLPVEAFHRTWITTIWKKYWLDPKLRSACESLVPDLKAKQIFSLSLEQQTEESLALYKQNYDQIPSQPVKIKAQSPRVEQQTLPNKKPSEQKQMIPEVQNKAKDPKALNLLMQNGESQVASQKASVPPSLASKNKEKSFGFGSNKFQKGLQSKPETSPKKKRTLQNGEQQKQQINTIKQHMALINTYIGRILNQDQRQIVTQSLHYLGDAASIHTYYCQKIVNLGVVNKCLLINSEGAPEIIQKILELFEELAENREKNMTLFNDAKSVDFLKNILKQSLDLRQELPDSLKVISIVKKCWNSSNNFFAQGLLSMLFEMAKGGLNREAILEMLSASDLSYQVVNQIYQRGLFNVMIQVYKSPTKELTDKEKVEICHWARLVGKVCLNESIREKLYAIEVHTLTFEKYEVFRELNCVENLAFLYGNFSFEFEKVASWCVKQKIPELFLQEMQSCEGAIPSDYFKFLRFLSQNGNQCIEYLYRIKMNVFYIETTDSGMEKIPQQSFKHYFKAIAHMFVPAHYDKFLKANFGESLIKRFDSFHSCFIVECLQKLVSQIKDKKELELLEKQGLFTINRVFNSKVKDDMSYPFVLQIYIDLLRKFQKFNSQRVNLELVIKVIRKAIFSINMEGKRKSLELILLLSEIDKISYGYSSCYRLFQSLFNYNMSLEEIQLFLTYLQIETRYPKPPRASEEERLAEEEKYPVRFKNIVDVTNYEFVEILASKFNELRGKLEGLKDSAEGVRKQLDILVEALLIIFINEANAVTIFEKIWVGLVKEQATWPYYFETSLKLLCHFTGVKVLHPNLKQSNLVTYIQKLLEYLIGTASSDQKMLQLFSTLLQRCLTFALVDRQTLYNIVDSRLKKSNIASKAPLAHFLTIYKTMRSEQQVTESIKGIVAAGVRVRMYKSDGSNSSLLLLFSPDMLELNCVASIGEPVKGKWRMALRDITKMQEYTPTQGNFKQSEFYLSEGIFSKAPAPETCLTLIAKDKTFNIGFESQGVLKEWKKYIELGKSRAVKIFQEISAKSKV